jgi:hypothetical protein
LTASPTYEPVADPSVGEDLQEQIDQIQALKTEIEENQQEAAGGGGGWLPEFDGQGGPVAGALIAFLVFLGLSRAN